jgi:pimeloyl-ACP methyl ester carboxylesterase
LASQTATIDGVPLRWEETGDGPVVVLVHGIPTSPELWRHVVPLLDGARVLAFEMLGYGRSILAGRGHDLSITAQARYLTALLDHLGIDQVVLVGHDLGGGVAQIAAVERPERITGIVLTNAIAYDSWPIPRVKMLRAISSFTARLPAPALKATLGSLLVRGHDDPAMARESLDLHYARYVAADGAAGLARQVSALDVNDTLTVAHRLEHLDIPARVVWGLSDQFQKARYGERLARALGTRPIGISGGKHFTPEDHPDIIARATHELLTPA